MEHQFLAIAINAHTAQLFQPGGWHPNAGIAGHPYVANPPPSTGTNIRPLRLSSANSISGLETYVKDNRNYLEV